MSFITLDFETYYADGLGFKTQTNEEYLRDPRFEIIGVAVKVDDGQTQWFSGSKEEIKNWLLQFDWADSALLAHNTLFDGSVLAWHFGIVPAYYYDTLSMARAIHGVEAGGSLKTLAEYYGIGKKGTEVVDAYGKRREDFTPEELHRYGLYCINDVELTYKLFAILNKLHPMTDVNVIEQYKYVKDSGRDETFQQSEYDLIDNTLRMYIEPRLYVDGDMLLEKLDSLRIAKQKMLSDLAIRLGVDPGNEEAIALKLSSNKQFADLLVEHGVDVPKKISKTTNKETFAFAKTDSGFIELQSHPDPLVQQLCAVRLGTKSTIEETRIKRFFDIGARNGGLLPIPLKYYGAHTGRWSGMDLVNFQNLPSRDKNKKTLKNSVLAPPGYVIVNGDSSQIEARVCALLARQDDLVEQYRNNEDVYSIFASDVFHRPVSRETPMERFVGKTCMLGLQFGTGAAKLHHTLTTTPPGAPLDMYECVDIVQLYRQKYARIPSLWSELEQYLGVFMAWPTNNKASWVRGHGGVLEVTPEGFRLPNNFYIRYPNLQRANGGIVYTSRKGKVGLWGGAVTENVVQALARIVVGEQLNAISKLYKTVLTVHDSVVCLVPESEVEQGVATVTRIMSTPPKWWPALPVACEVKWGRSYGDC